MAEEQGLVLVNNAMELYKRKIAKSQTLVAKAVKENKTQDAVKASGFYENQVYMGVNKLRSAITAMSWDIAQDIVNRVFEQQLVHCEKIVRLLDSKEGTWSRGGKSTYKSLGRAKRGPHYNFINVDNGHKISISLMAIVTRWRHIP